LINPPTTTPDGAWRAPFIKGALGAKFIHSKKLAYDPLDLGKTECKIRELEEGGKTTMILASDKEILGLVAAMDTLKENTIEAVGQLQKRGIEVYMITGDNQRTAKAIAKQVGIKNVLAEVLPEDKAEAVRKLQNPNYKLQINSKSQILNFKNWKLEIGNSHKRVVAFVGDGINDAPALAQADLGIAMGGGTDVAMETGGIVIIKNDLRDVLTAIKLSRETMGKIKQNMFFALFYNAIGIPIATRMFAGLGLILKPELAGLAMALSSISVVSNSLLLRRFHPQRRNYLSQVAPVIMGMVFLLLFIVFAKWSSV